MRAIYLIKNAAADKAFEIREIPKPVPKSGEILVKVEGFGLNFSDIMSRKGVYPDAPPLPAIIGYDVCGRVEKMGANVSDLKEGDRITALTRFGGYAEYAITEPWAYAKISDDINVSEATALTTQCITAYYCAAELVNLRRGNKVVIHSAAGGVGTALLQFAKNKGCEIFATTGSASKVELLRQLGADHVINTSAEKFDEYIMKQTNGDGVDVIFDALGAAFTRKGMKILAAGGRLVCYGGSQLTNSSNPLSQIITLLQYGIYHPLQFMMGSKSLIGVNMLNISAKKTEVMAECLQNVMRLVHEGILKPRGGSIFKAENIAGAHKFVEQRKSTGKVACEW